jgi:HEAT repeat protein
VFGATVAHAVDDMLQTGRFQELLEILDAAPDTSTAPAEAWDYLSAPEQVRYLLTHDEYDVEGVQRVLERLGTEAAGSLLDALATATSRAMRHRLLSTLTGMGSTIGPLVAARLSQAEWYVKRNLLILLGSLPEWPEGFSPETYARADDARVRREAVKLMLQAEEAEIRDSGILIGVADDDASIVRMVLTAATAACPPKAERQVLELLEDDDGDIRVLAIRVLGCFTTSRARQTLLNNALAKRKWWQRRRRLAAASPQMLAALSGLAKTWPDAPDVQPVLDAARNSSHEEIRAMVTPA